MGIAERMRTIRVREGLSQKELGEKTNLTGYTICQYEKGSRSISDDKLELLASAMGYEVALIKKQVAPFLNISKEDWDNALCGYDENVPYLSMCKYEDRTVTMYECYDEHEEDKVLNTYVEEGKEIIKTSEYMQFIEKASDFIDTGEKICFINITLKQDLNLGQFEDLLDFLYHNVFRR